MSRIDRPLNLARAFDENDVWDVIVVGGGATGVGIAVDAATRGYRCVLFEQSDFGKGTSSRSTKLAHGGVRYLQQGRIGLVTEALRERSILRRNAPHLVRSLPFLVPSYRRWETPYYSLGMALYGMLSGPGEFGRSRALSRSQALAQSPGLNTEGLRGGVLYFDGQFDDARLLINLAQTAAEHGATLLNYVQVQRTIHGENGLVAGVLVRDLETGREKEIPRPRRHNAAWPFFGGPSPGREPEVAPVNPPRQGDDVGDRKALPPRQRGGHGPAYQRRPRRLR